MTRTSDLFVSLSARVAYANSKNVDGFLSIHANAYTAAAHGSETFCYYSGSGHSFNMRNKTQDEIVAHGGLANRGVKTAGFYVIKYTYMPAVLTELGFVTNKGDREKAAAVWRSLASEYPDTTQGPGLGTNHEPRPRCRRNRQWRYAINCFRAGRESFKCFRAEQ